MSHVIHKLTFELSCLEENESFRIRKEFVDHFQNRFVEIIQQYCEDLIPEEVMIQIDSLEIDLGSVEDLGLNKNKLFFLFEEKLQNILLKELNNKDDSPHQNGTEKSQLNLLQHFLMSGVLPWWAKEKEVNLHVICAKLISYPQLFKQFISFLYQQKEDTFLWKRMANQLDDSFLDLIVFQFPKLIDTKTDLVSFQSKKIIQTIILYLENQGLTNFKVQLETQRSRFIISYATKVLSGMGKKNGDLFFLYLDSILKKENSPFSNNVFNMMKSAGFLNPDSLIEDVENIMSLEDKSVQTSQKLVILNAGIILLTPFLKQFFTELNLWQNNNWVNSQAQNRAVFLLYYLGNGKSADAEYQLPLEKIICGLPLGMPLERNILLSSIEKEEADHLIWAVISHWKALKNTSIEGLRQSFLHRNGLLFEENGTWMLQVEKQTVDVLMDQLPWTWNIIQLPWNHYLIKTIW